MLSLVEDFKNWKKWWSMRFIIISTFFQAITVAYVTLPADWMPSIPEGAKLFFASGALLTAGAAGVARVVSQPRLREEKKTENPNA